MRLRLLATAAFLLTLLVPVSLADARPSANPYGDRARLRELMDARHRLIGEMVAQNGPRGQALTLAALVTADALLSADAAALQRQIVRLSWHPHPRIHIARQQTHSAPPFPLLAVDTPGTVWSPLARGLSAGPAATPSADSTRIATTMGMAQDATVAPPDALLAAIALPGINSRHLPLPSPTPVALPVLSAPRPVTISSPEHEAQSYGRLMLATGTGAVPAATINSAVLAASLVPLPVPHKRHTARALRRTAPRPVLTLALLQQRWRRVSAALAQVRALESWVRSNAPGSLLTPNDVIPSPALLHQRLDRWTAEPSIDISATAPITSFLSSSVAAPDLAAGATLALSTTTAISDAVDISGTLDISGTRGTDTSRIAESVMTNTLPSTITAAIPIMAVSSITDAITTTTTVTPGAVITPSLAAVTATATTITATGTTAALTGTSGITATVTPTATETMAGMPTSSTAPLTAAVPTTDTAPVTPGVGLNLSVEPASCALTVTTALSASAPLTLVVTLPVTADGTLAPPDFLSKRGALESVLREGEAVYARLKASEAAVQADYHARLNSVVAYNTGLERAWWARYDARQRYLGAYSTYVIRKRNFDAYAHRLHMAQLAHDAWVKRKAAWDQYQRELAAYNAALAHGQPTPSAPISGTTPPENTAVPLPPKPVAPPEPGPEPRFTERPPTWPGSPPVYVPPAGPEPSGLPLPNPPAAIPPWDTDDVPPVLAVISYGGIALGVNAAGRKETTQAELLANGALDLVGSYQDPIKGVITTYWGGSTRFQSFHPGVDIAAPEYTPVHAAAAGRVIWAGLAVPGDDHASYGNCVIIKHNDHFTTLYAHMDDRIHPLQVHAGDIVQQGQVIGYVGMTGWTTGPHLHFEIREDNIQVNPLLLIPNPQD